MVSGEMKRGFTLVELAIVLVIIGLLAGGILVARSMIETAQIQSVARQLSQFDMAVSNFRVKYNSLPGDSKFFASPGDGDGIIQNSDTKAGIYTNTNRFFDLEYANFWAHLALSGFMPDKVVYSNDATGGIRAGVQVPFAVYGTGAKKAGVLMHRSSYPNDPFYYYCDFSTSTSGNIDGGAGQTLSYTPAMTLALDKKIDDGLPRAVNMALHGGVMWVPDPVMFTNQCYDTVKYTYKTSNSKQCCFYVSILGGTEDLP